MRQLGNSNVYISPILLGTAALGGTLWGETDEQASIEAIKTSIANGITSIDTAPAYGFGLSEELVGRAIKGCRDQVVIATKCGMKWSNKENPLPGEDPILMKRNCKPEVIFSECEESLKRLDTDRIDLYQIHWPDPDVSIEESWQAMVTLKKQGKVRAIGVSNYNLEQLKKAHALYPVDSIQLPYSLIRRSIESDILPFCQKNKIGVLAYSSLERELLTGNVSPERQFPEGDHRSTYDLFSLENRRLILDAFKKIKHIADTHCATLAQLVIATTMNLPGITGILAGARNGPEALENAKALKLELSPEERQFIVDTFHSESLRNLPGTK